MFLGLERIADDGAKARDATGRRPGASKARVDQALDWLDRGRSHGVGSPGRACWPELYAQGSTIKVIDMLEQGLDQATQQALIAWLRRRAVDASPLFFLTRSSAILDLGAVGLHEAIIFCPANHSAPSLVAPYSRRAGLRSVGFLSRHAASAGADRGRHRMATRGGMIRGGSVFIEVAGGIASSSMSGRAPGGPIRHISRSRHERARHRSRASAPHSWNAMITWVVGAQRRHQAVAARACRRCSPTKVPNSRSNTMKMPP